MLEAKEGTYKKESIESIEESIKGIYLDTQKVLMTKYFDKMVTMLTTIEEVDFYSEKFLNYDKILGLVKNNRAEVLDYYEEYKEKIMVKFDKQLMKISKNKGKNTLSTYNNRVGRMLKKIISRFDTNN